MDEKTIHKQYITLPNEKVKLLCSYTTRKEGFLDILLSGCVMSSDESHELFGNVKAHRTLMSSDESDDYFDRNNYISLSTGFVSYRYSDRSIQERENYFGGFGVFIPLEKVLAHPYLGFSHCSEKGGIKDFKLNRENLVQALHIARKKGELFDNDGYGNVFEIQMNPKLGTRGTITCPEILSYPRINLKEVTVAIPANERDYVMKGIARRQSEYKSFLDKVSGKDFKELEWKIVEGRYMSFPELMIPFIESLTKPFDIAQLPILWYKERNLDIALQSQAII